MTVKRSKIRWEYESWKYEYLFDGGKSANDDDETTASGRPFQTWAAATGKARLPTVSNYVVCIMSDVVYNAET